MSGPRALTRVKYSFLKPAEPGERRASLRRGAIATLAIVLLVGLPIHALADQTLELGPVERVVIPLDRDFERTYTWRGTVQLAAPASTWVWPTLYVEGAPIGSTDLRGITIPDIRTESYLDGKLVTASSFGGDFGAGFSGSDHYGCKPRSACDWPPLAWGFREAEVMLVATVTHEGNPQARGLSQEYTLGPMQVILDRCPCW